MKEILSEEFYVYSGTCKWAKEGPSYWVEGSIVVTSDFISN